MHPAPIAEVLSLATPAGHALGAAFAGFAHAAAPVAIAALWQSAAIALGLALCLRLTPRMAAAHRFSVWAGGFAVAVAMQVLPLWLHSALAAGGASAAGVGGLAALPWLENPILERPFFDRPILQLDARWTLAIAALWLALGALRAADLALHTLRLRRLWKNANPIEGLFAQSASGRGRVPVCATTELDHPSVIGFFTPRVLIPAWLYARLTPAELEQVILHECEHLRRRDDWTNLAQKLALVLFPLNPALVWMEHRLCREREMACDEGVVRVTRAPRAYAACLASMAERRLEQNLAQSLTQRASAALSLGAFERRSELAGRVHSILRRKNAMGPLGARAVLGAVGCVLLVGALELERTPQVVAFVSAQPAEAQIGPQLLAQDSSAQPAVANGRSLVLDRRNEAQFRATDAIAILPAAPQRASRNGAAKSDALEGPAAHREATANGMAFAAPRQQAVRADVNRAGANTARAIRSVAQGDGEPQQWIVLTTWEQVEAPAAEAGKVSDYNASADGKAAPAQTASRAERQFSVTQLILRVYPASSVSAPGQKTNSAAPDKAAAQIKATSSSDMSRRAVLPLGNGWLVIQL